MQDMNELLDDYLSQKSMHRTEGMAGVKNLCRIVRALGYKDDMYRMQLDVGCALGDLLEFLQDNPGAIEALIDWIGNQEVTEWKENLDSRP
jgi:hypothetical protein